jgi:hypothetical protein
LSVRERFKGLRDFHKVSGLEEEREFVEKSLQTLEPEVIEPAALKQ